MTYLPDRFTSVQGRPIEVLEVGAGLRTVLVMAGVHGDEPQGVAIVTKLVEMLRTEPVEDATVVLMPAANPDGLALGTRQNANGIDLNRSFPTSDFGTGEDKPQYYSGSAAASEPETRAIMSLIEACRPRLVISIHEPLGCVNYNGPSRRIALRISRATGLPAVDDIGYPCPGSMGTYYGRERRVPLITLELPRDEIDPAQWADTLLRVVRDWASARGSTGRRAAGKERPR